MARGMRARNYVTGDGRLSQVEVVAPNPLGPREPAVAFKKTCKVSEALSLSPSGSNLKSSFLGSKNEVSFSRHKIDVPVAIVVIAVGANVIAVF
jgi:hypothetical protein